ncbi:MAG: Calx-beta domain-containing protein [Pyrinomonadaceae bacterium]
MPHPSTHRAAVTTIVATLVLSIAAVAAAAGGPGTISFTSLTYEVGEGAGSASVTLTRTGGTDGAVAAKVTPAGGTASAADFLLKQGEVDPTFTRHSSVNSTYQNDIVIQPDGKILVGQVRTVLRLLPNGNLDPTFTPPTLNGHVASVALLPDGKILIGGGFTVANDQARGLVLRLNSDGSIDPTFNAAPGLTTSDGVYVVAGTPDGKVMIGGYFTNVNGVPRSHLARLNSDGTLDTGFDPPLQSNIYVMVVQPDGKVIAGGFGLFRFNPDGSYDPGFYGGQSPLSGFPGALALRPDGKLYVGGTFTSVQGTPRSKLALLNGDGTLDTSFDPGAGTDYAAESMALQPDGKLIISGGFNTIGGVVRRRVARLNADGSVDTSFASTFTDNDPTVTAIALQSDGKVVVGGSFPFYVKRLYGDLFAIWRDGDAADKTVTIPIVNDLLDESDETLELSLTLSGGAAAGAIPSATLNIIDDDAAPQFTSGAPAQAIAGQFYTHTFTATGSPAPTFSVTAGSLPPGMFITSAGVLSGTTSTAGTYSGITVTASNGVAPAATQTFDLVVLSGGALQFDASAYTVNENAGTATITVNRVGGSAGAASVNFSITGNTASSGSDFAPANATLNFADGETSKTVTVTIIDDAVNERDEIANLFLNSVAGTGRLGTPTVASLTILNDDPLPTIAVDDITVTEGDSGSKLATFTVTRTGLTDRFINFTARTSDGSAVAGEDFLALTTSTFQLSPTSATTTVSVNVLGDTLIEPDKSFALLLTSPVNASISDGSGVCVIKDNDTTTGLPTVQFAANEFKVSEGAGVATVTVTRSGDSSAPTTISYQTTLWSGLPSSGSAWDRTDYTYTGSTLRFAAGETSKTIQVFITDDALVEGDETLNVFFVNGPTGGVSTGAPAITTVRIIDNDTAPSAVNPIDDSTFFVRQHYRDFLGRDPDPSGLQFWTGEIEKCGADLQCREVKRVNVSAAFFLSIEFQETGYFDYLLYKAAFNTGERISFGAFANDTLQLGRDVVVGSEGWEQKLASNKQAFADSFVARSNFLTAYPQAMSPDQFVDALNANTGDPLNPSAGGALTKAERDALVTELTSGVKTRAQVLRAVAENAEFRRRQLSKAFVLMQYFGYLRRAPNATPDTTYDGYNFWLGKLNQFQGNYINAEMVKAFINSTEYRKRFGQ